MSERLKEHFLLIGILILAAFLRFYHLDASSLWSDEGNTWALIQRSFGEISRAAAADIHPPGFYWLLKLWSIPFGVSADAMRSFSALCGVLLAFVIARIAALTAQSTEARRWLPLVAALIAAVNPFQVYYSQEARMYMLLALLSAALFWSLLAMLRHPPNADRRWFSLTGAEIGYWVSGVFGLWTHYSFPIVLLAACVAYALLLVWRRRSTQHVAQLGVRFLLLNGLILLAYLPWLPTAIERVLAWPKGDETTSLVQGLVLTLRTLLFGPLRHTPSPQWPWLIAAALLPVIGGVALWRRAGDRDVNGGRMKTSAAPAADIDGAVVLAVWLAAPIVLMFAAGLFSDAFLKFLLVASPPWCVLIAAAGWIVAGRLRWLLVAGIAVGAVVLALLTLPAYYADPTARDNYQGVAAYLAVVGDPQHDLVLLDAPGQADVWRYYDPGLPLALLPEQRPADREQTIAALTAASADRRTVYALFWATDESDPQRIVESWLDQNAFKGLESWQGNLRFVRYTRADDLRCTERTPLNFAEQLALVGECEPQPTQQVVAGEAALVRLLWSALRPMTQRYKVSVQLLDERNQVIAQHDSEPAGGSRPTTTWSVGETVEDSHGLAVPIGVPPGVYRLIATVYDAESGARLAHSEGDSVALGAVEVMRSTQPFPADLLPVQQRVDQMLGPLTLIGADVYKKGFGHAPTTPLQTGDLLHVTLYWQAPDPLPADWPIDLQVTLELGDQTVNAPLAGGAYTTGKWQAGELVRGEFDIPFTGSDHSLEVSVNNEATYAFDLPQ